MYQDLWGSLVALSNDIIDVRKVEYNNIKFIDWEAHANIQELPDSDLIGTTALTITEEEPDLFSFSFTIGVSTFADDGNLFRLRAHVEEVFKRLRPGSKLAFYDRVTMAQKGWLIITDGTIVMPMTKADVRPLQFIQCQGVFDAVTGVGSG